ncbi:hypothetical protein [Actinomadura sp. 6K520]|uniref:hypothetical protein n=1 Tax=Actinomadura sp. 6K520 TaxID=2530364 RepID=UPI00104F434F|nr:hypothetical protein [Actinomadura sp. 6K520]TDE37649.1 hypothetical protein E1289_03590 [Actinomadura sp. 6K520]
MTIPVPLEQYLGAPTADPPVVDWQKVMRQLGTDLPSDYKELANRYPLLMIDEWLPILHPGTPDPPGNEYGLVNLVRYATTQSRFVANLTPTLLYTYTPSQGEGVEEVRSIAANDFPFPIYPDAGGLMAWGMPEDGSRCCWLTQGSPDEWTVVVASEPEFWHYRGSITEFLVDILVRRVQCRAFPEGFPIGDSLHVEQIFD